jgi:hypothetical protein
MAVSIRVKDLYERVVNKPVYTVKFCYSCEIIYVLQNKKQMTKNFQTCQNNQNYFLTEKKVH